MKAAMSSSSKNKSKSGPIPIGQMLEDSVLSTLKARTHLHKKLLQRIQAALPQNLSDHCIACVLRLDGLLVIYTDSAAWACQLRFYQSTVLSEAALVGPVTRIKIRIWHPPANAATKPKSDSVRVPAKGVLNQLLHEAQCNQDEDISQALLGLVKAMRRRSKVNKLAEEAPPAEG